MIQIREPTDEILESLQTALAQYEAEHPSASAELYRYNPASVRVRVVDPTFKHLTLLERHDLIWSYLSGLPDDVLSDLTMLLCVTPDEITTIGVEFDDQLHVAG